MACVQRPVVLVLDVAVFEDEDENEDEDEKSDEETSTHFIQIQGEECLSIELRDLMNENTHWCESLYEERAAGLILYGRALGLSHCEAEDVLQETFAALLRLERKPLEPGHYCLRAFRNRALNYRRGLWRRVARELEATRWFECDPANTVAERNAMKCLEDLPGAQREVVVLKVWHGYTFEQIGTLLEVSPNTVAGRYRYGLQKIKLCMKGKGYEPVESTGDTIALLETA